MIIQPILATLIFIVCLVLIFTDKLNRAIAALGGAVLMVGVGTSVVSMFLDNVTTVVLIAPVTILICEILGLNPQPFLISEALLSDTAGVSTPGGGPPNVLIASAANLSFLDFITHSLPI